MYKGMGSKVFPVRLDEGDVRQVDLLVRLGVFKSRSEALRKLIRLGFKSLEELVEISEALERLFQLEGEEGEIPIRLDGALRRLLSERGRFT